MNPRCIVFVLKKGGKGNKSVSRTPSVEQGGGGTGNMCALVESLDVPLAPVNLPGSVAVRQAWRLRDWVTPPGYRGVGY